MGNSYTNYISTPPVFRFKPEVFLLAYSKKNSLNAILGFMDENREQVQNVVNEMVKILL